MSQCLGRVPNILEETTINHVCFNNILVEGYIITFSFSSGASKVHNSLVSMSAKVMTPGQDHFLVTLRWPSWSATYLCSGNLEVAAALMASNACARRCAAWPNSCSAVM